MCLYGCIYKYACRRLPACKLCIVLSLKTLTEAEILSYPKGSPKPEP